MTNLDFKTYLNTKTQLVSDNIKSTSKNKASWVEPTGYAEDRKYVSLNPGHCKKVRFLTIDCDHDRYDEFPGSFPKPLCTVINRKNERHHHVFELATPVLTDVTARWKPKVLLAVVEQGFIQQLDGDDGYTNTLTKNPWNKEAWSTIWWPDFKPIELKDCTVWYDEEETKPANDNAKFVSIKSVGHGRRVNLFNHVRHLAYQNYFRSWNGEDSAVYSAAYALNATFHRPLPDCDIRSTCKSIIKFMNERYIGGTGTPYERKTPKVSDKLEILKDAIKDVQSQGELYNATYLAEMTGFPTRTVSRLLKKI
ncbi:replication initiation protein [Thalassospira australica]|uniref:replication initiation protein n=1 Tax=Thalassospira australica TaxID=1528106 RepID=UPI0009E032C8|nr:replication initiation protein [Thalassospira australica]